MLRTLFLVEVTAVDALVSGVAEPSCYKGAATPTWLSGEELLFLHVPAHRGKAMVAAAINGLIEFIILFKKIFG